MTFLWFEGTRGLKTKKSTAELVRNTEYWKSVKALWNHQHWPTLLVSYEKILAYSYLVWCAAVLFCLALPGSASLKVDHIRVFLQCFERYRVEIAGSIFGHLQFQSSRDHPFQFDVLYLVSRDSAIIYAIVLHESKLVWRVTFKDWNKREQRSILHSKDKWQKPE